MKCTHEYKMRQSNNSWFDVLDGCTQFLLMHKIMPYNLSWRRNSLILWNITISTPFLVIAPFPNLLTYSPLQEAKCYSSSSPVKVYISFLQIFPSLPLNNLQCFLNMTTQRRSFRWRICNIFYFVFFQHKQMKIEAYRVESELQTKVLSTNILKFHQIRECTNYQTTNHHDHTFK
jgi:hypothetical protein